MQEISTTSLEFTTTTASLQNVLLLCPSYHPHSCIHILYTNVLPSTQSWIDRSSGMIEARKPSSSSTDTRGQDDNQRCKKGEGPIESPSVTNASSLLPTPPVVTCSHLSTNIPTSCTESIPPPKPPPVSTINYLPEARPCSFPITTYPTLLPPPHHRRVFCLPTTARHGPVTIEGRELRETHNEANLYAIFRTTEQLEKAFASGILDKDLYEAECLALIAQYRTAQSAVKTKYPEMSSFLKANDMYCPLAEERLVQSGLPATRHYAHSLPKSDTLAVFELSGHFITLLDAVKLNERAVDGLLPLMQETVTGLSRVPSLPASYQDSAVRWLNLLNSKQAFEDITAEQSRQLCLDMETAYTNFRNWLEMRDRRS